LEKYLLFLTLRYVFLFDWDQIGFLTAAIMDVWLLTALPKKRSL